MSTDQTFILTQSFGQLSRGVIRWLQSISGFDVFYSDGLVVLARGKVEMGTDRITSCCFPVQQARVTAASLLGVGASPGQGQLPAETAVLGSTSLLS